MRHNSSTHKTLRDDKRTAAQGRRGECTPPTANRRGGVAIVRNDIKFAPKVTLSNSKHLSDSYHKHHSTNPLDYNVDLSWEPSSQDWEK